MLCAQQVDRINTKCIYTRVNKQEWEPVIVIEHSIADLNNFICIGGLETIFNLFSRIIGKNHNGETRD